jgi:hypothetical protein
MSTRIISKDIRITSSSEASSNTNGTLSTLGGINVTKQILTSGGINSVSNTNTFGNLFTTGGNIGIGTTAPIQKLQIFGDVNLRGSFFQNGSIYTGITPWSNTGSNLYFNNGNVGIGTLTQSYSLDVRTSISSSYVYTGNFISTGLTSGQQNGIVIGKANTANNVVELRHFHVSDGSNQNMLRIGTSGTDNRMIIRYDGNIGINTTAPRTSLEMSGGNLLISNTTGRLAFYSGTDNFIYNAGTVGHYSITYNSEAGVPQGPVGYMSGYGGLRVFTQGAPRLNIDFSGNIGIGTTSPSARLDVNGSFVTRGIVNTVGTLFVSGGNMGIGTVGAPKHALHVGGGGLMISSNNPIVDQGAYIHWNRTGSGGETWFINQIGGGFNNSIRFASAATNGSTVTEWWRFQSNNLYNMVGGNIYIDSSVGNSQFIFGYNTPKSSTQEDRLQIYNNVSDRNLPFRVGSKGTSSGIDYVDSIAAFVGSFNSNTVGNLFTTGGNVGIGTGTPATALQVNGVIKSTIPSWSLYMSNGTAIGSGSVVTYNATTVTSQNITVNSGTGRVTCTVAGRYFVTFSAFADNNSATTIEIWLRKNGTNVARAWDDSKVANQWGPSLTIRVLVEMVVNDYLDVFVTNLGNGASLHFNDNMYFMGYMIG